ncbi:MAG: PVC-type heme-binding CxxCH protein [Bacteroidota bacterium]
MIEITSRYFFQLLIWIFVGGCILSSSCTSPTHSPREPRSAKETDFEEADDMEIQLTDGFDLNLWAPGPLLSNAVALTFDPHGVAYVSETQRRKSSDIDIRQHRDWMTEELGLSSLEETEAFHYAKLDTALGDQNTWQEDFNEDGKHDWRDLMVQSEYIRRVWDSDGDGRADTSTLFADGFNDMLTGVAAGILRHRDDIFLTAAPDVWRIQDQDQDGIADHRTSISKGYGIHIGYAGHDMSGLALGMDGKVYWSIGDIGVNVTGPDGKKWEYPHEGAVMRANPDGSDFEIFAHGLRNPQELAFDEYGNLISVDNDGDHKGEQERIVHILEGSDSGWRIHWQFGKYNQPHEDYKVWINERLHLPHFAGQAAFLLPPISKANDGPAGLAYNPGTAMGGQWKHYFFSSHFKGSAARSQIVAFRLQSKGASFELAEEKRVILGIASTGVSFGPDGALYIADWKDSYDKKTEGRIWKLDVPANQVNPLRQETQKLLAEGFSQRSKEELRQLLAHADMRVRMETQFELVQRNETAILLQSAQNSPSLLARLHGIWGLGQLTAVQQDVAETLLPLLSDPEPEVRAQTLKVIGETKYEAASDLVITLLSDKHPRVLLYASEAAGKLQLKQARNPLLDILEQIEESDPHLRHAVAYALARIGNSDIAKMHNHPSKWVRLGIVVALRNMRSWRVGIFLKDEDPQIATEAARAINDDVSIPEALPQLAKALSRTEIKDEAFIRRAINANLRLGDAESVDRLLTFAKSPDVSPAMRADALWALGCWAEPPVLDRVDGRYRELLARDPQLAASRLLPDIGTFLSQTTPISTTAAEVSGRLAIQDVDNRLFAIVKQQGQPTDLRKAALQSLALMNSSLVKEAIDIALDDRQLGVRTEAQALIGTLKLPIQDKVEMLAKVMNNGLYPEQQKALASLGQMADGASANLLQQLLQKMIIRQLQPELQLDVLMAAEARSEPVLQESLKKYTSTYLAEDALAGYRETMLGGDADKGARLAYRHETAQCFRCHQIQGQGGLVGPDLTGIAARLSTEQLLEALVDPSARIAPGYGAENAPSSMPSMKSLMSKEDIRHIMAFLSSLKEDS